MWRCLLWSSAFRNSRKGHQHPSVSVNNPQRRSAPFSTSLSIHAVQYSLSLRSTGDQRMPRATSGLTNRKYGRSGPGRRASIAWSWW